MKILLVEDLDDDRKAIGHVLQKAGHELVSKSNAEEALSQSESVIRSFDVAVLDWQLPRKNGLELGQALFSKNPRLFLVMLTGYATLERKMEATQYGGFIHFISKPGSSELLDTLRILEPQVQERRSLFKKIARAGYGIVGSSPAIVRLREVIAIVAPTDARVLILGETGTGKELAAHAIHSLSRRSEAKFVVAHCGAFSPQLLESELFGHEKGAFTGATERRIGRFEQANGGTIFLDEVGEIDASTQVKLLRVLSEERTFERVGGNQTLRADVRIVAATNRNLEKLVQENKFRDDLFYRLNVVPITMPPLRERKDDILVLAEYFLQQFRPIHNKKAIQTVPSAVKDLLLAYQWPGNVRELQSAIEHAVVFETMAEIQPTSLPDSVRMPQQRSLVSVSRTEGRTSGATLSSGADAKTASLSAPANDLAEIISCCADMLATDGASIGNNGDNIFNSQGPQVLKMVLAAFWTEVVAKRMTEQQFNKLFGLHAGKRASMGVGQYLQQLTRKSPVFRPYSGTTSYCKRDLVADGRKLTERGFIMPAATSP